ncbi:MAG: hypothetical protein R3F65_24930 [bacterium]
MADNALAGALDFLQEIEAGHDERFGELSRGLTNQLFALMRTAGMHDLENDALHRPLRALEETVAAFFDSYGEQVHLALIDGNFFVNRRIVRLDFGSFQNIRYLRRIFEFLGVNEMSFLSPVGPGELKPFLRAFLDVIAGGGDIKDTELGPIRLRMREEEQFDELRRGDDPRHRVLSIYASGLLMLRQFVNDLRKGRSPRHAKVKRLCLELIDVDPRHHGLLLALVHLEAYKGNLFCHMLNTAVLALVFGGRIGLTREQLVDLGMAAFHHDLGWALLGTLDEGRAAETDVALTMEGINYARNHSAGEIGELRVKVARALVRLGGFNELIINRLIVAYECQIPEDAPPAGLYYGDIGASFMTHVVRMASTYDELTTARNGEPPLRPDQAMKRILDDGGMTYDVFLAKLFANCLGGYPIGTLVELDSGEVGLVVNLPSNPVNYHRPQVKILIDRRGSPLADGPIIDLDATVQGGRHARSIERALDARDHDISITRFFFG